MNHKLTRYLQFSDACNMVTVTNASYASCNGLYRQQRNLSVDWAPLKPVYKHLTENRYIFWREATGYQTEWVIGKLLHLSTGSSFHQSKCMKTYNNLQ